MSNVYYTSLTGMLAASYGLQNTSNNVANMESPGYKKTDAFYSSLGFDEEHGGLGTGVKVSGSTTNFSEGKYIATSNPTDLAVVGNGFFVVRLKSGEYLYTRDGEFYFNEEDVLVDRHSGGIVQGYNSAGRLMAVKKNGPEHVAGKPTHNVYLKGKWVVEKEKIEEGNGDDTKEITRYKNVTIDTITIFDEKGASHKVSLEFKCIDNMPPTGGTEWSLIDVQVDGMSLWTFNEQTIQFRDKNNGSVLEEYANISFQTAEGQEINIHFGGHMEDADNSVVTLDKDFDPAPIINPIEVRDQDGYGEGNPIDFSFTENGQIIYRYDNGQTVEGIHIALARFDNVEDTLIQARDNLFRAKSNQGRHIGIANKNGFGNIQQKQLETSNVDATNEFANIVVLQRMFQACSQIMDIDKQLIEQLERER